MPKRIHRKLERTPEEEARLQAIRDQFQQQKPTLESLLASGDYTEPVPQGEYVLIHQLAARLKRAREGAGLSLSEVETRSGIDKAALSRLETGQQLNPTLNTLARYAAALGMRWKWELLDLEEGRPPPHATNDVAAMKARLEELEGVVASLGKVILASKEMRVLLMNDLKSTG